MVHISAKFAQQVLVDPTRNTEGGASLYLFPLPSSGRVYEERTYYKRRVREEVIREENRRGN